MRTVLVPALMLLAACPATEGNPAELWLHNGKTETTVSLVEVKPKPW